MKSLAQSLDGAGFGAMVAVIIIMVPCQCWD